VGVWVVVVVAVVVVVVVVVVCVSVCVCVCVCVCVYACVYVRGVGHTMRVPVIMRHIKGSTMKSTRGHAQECW
jgi:hypothetical protein